MQRVLSIQTARGFGESSEFVTKRSCISFLFAIGFLCLLGGFMLGRFAVHRTIMARAERTRLQFAENGLEATEHLQYKVLEFLQDANFAQESLVRDLGTLPENQIEIFSGSGLIEQVSKYKSCSIGRVQGSQESDRYVIVSVVDKEVELLSEIIKSLNKIHMEQEWNPRRTILFCVCEKSTKDCFHELSDYVKSKVVAFITQVDSSLEDLNSPPADDCLLVSGSNIAGTALQKAADFVKSFDPNALNFCNQRHLTPAKIELDVPQGVLSFVNPKRGNRSLDVEDSVFLKSRKIIARVIALTVWRLSESIILPWNQRNFNETVLRTLMSAETSRLFESPEEKVDFNKLLGKVSSYVESLNSLEVINLLNVRIANDLLLDLDKTFLCLESQHWQPLGRLIECYKNLNGILEA